MFIHKSSRNNSPVGKGATSRGSLRKRLASAFQVLVHGEQEHESGQRRLDPRIVAGIDRDARVIAEAYGDPLAGSFARDILTESAYVIVDSFGEAAEEARQETTENDATADLLIHGRRKST